MLSNITAIITEYITSIVIKGINVFTDKKELEIL